MSDNIARPGFLIRGNGERTMGVFWGDCPMVRPVFKPWLHDSLILEACSHRRCKTPIAVAHSFQCPHFVGYSGGLMPENWDGQVVTQEAQIDCAYEEGQA